MKPSDQNQPAARVTAAVRKRFPELSELKIEYVPGQEEAFVQWLQRQTGESREALLALVRWAGGSEAPASDSMDALVHGSRAEIEQSLGSGIPEDTSRSGANGI